MPAFNEQEALPRVVREWTDELARSGIRHTLCILDDGSTDGTRAVLHALVGRHPEMLVLHKPNSGHGQTCLDGYRRALAAGADWVLQLDSDGQCDPRFFRRFWDLRTDHPVIYGQRTRREDGWTRGVISCLVSIVTFTATGTWVTDANVPYRLMRADALADAIPRIPPDFHLANVLLAVLQQRRYGIRWIPIVFRNRAGGTPSVKPLSFGRRGWQLFRQLRRLAR